jgi:predicted GH43/DUF377 family glycosyl hydrolase
MTHPSIQNQGFAVFPINGDQLLKSGGNRHFNPGLAVTPHGRMLMAYRYHPNNPAAPLITRLAICELNTTNGATVVGHSQVLELPLPSGLESQEDPRLFWHKGHLWLVYTEAYGYHGTWTCAMRLVRLEQHGGKWVVAHVVPLSYGDNVGGREKNWQFFSYQDRLMFVYSIKPHVVVEIDDTTGLALGSWITNGIQGWAFGTLSGGTPPVLMHGEYVSVFHSAEPHRLRTRRYNASVYMFEAEPPFAILRCSKPFVFASEADPFSPDVRGVTDPCVVFPGGAVPAGGNALMLSLGVNDCSSSLLRLNLGKIQCYHPVFPVVSRYFWTDLAAMPLVIDREVRATWEITRQGVSGPEGVLATADPNVINQLRDREDVKEISHVEYQDYRETKAVPNV